MRGSESVERVWVTTDGARPRSLRQRGEQVELLSALDQRNVSLRRLLEGVWRAVRLRPKCVISSGAGVVVPFVLTARLLGARVLYLETMARVQHGSVAGRVLSRVADRVLVQWEELRGQYPSATVCAPILLEQDEDVRAANLPGRPPGGTFIAVGSHPVPFDRLLAAVDRAIAAGVLPRPVLAQVGPGSLTSSSAENRVSLTPAAFAEAISSHKVVVCHAGAGVMAAAIREGRRPLVMARRSNMGEHVDDHQADLLRKLSELDLIVELEDEITVDQVTKSERPRSPLHDRFRALPSVRDEVMDWLAEAR